MSTEPTADDEVLTLRVEHGVVVRLVWAAGLRITGEIAKDAIRAVDDLNGDLRRPMLVDFTASATTTRDSRAVFAGESSVTRIALLGRSVVDRTIANFTLLVDPPPVPTRYFTDEDAAIAWLLG